MQGSELKKHFYSIWLKTLLIIQRGSFKVVSVFRAYNFDILKSNKILSV